MRIALVSQEYPPETAKGGIGTQAYAKAHGLAARGHEVHVISRSVDDRLREYSDGAVHVIRIPDQSRRMTVYTEVADWLTYSNEVAIAVATLHGCMPLDIVEFPEWGAEGYVHLLNRTEWNDIPCAIHLHGPLVMLAHTIGWPDLDSEFYRTGTAMEGTCLRLADAIFSSSACSADWCAKYYGLQRENIPVIHTGVDIGHFRPCDVPKEERPTIIFAGKLVPNKGIFVLLEAACRLAGEFPDLRLRLLGRGEKEVVQALEHKARAFPGLLDLPGFVSREELPVQLSRAHIFAAPSLYEGGPGFVYLEAMACGLPVIACAGSGAAEVVTPEETGFLVLPEDVDALVTALRSLFADATRSQLMGVQARRYVLENANSENCLSKIEAFYKSTIKGKKSI